MTEAQKCELCGEPMPDGEGMFKYHGYSGDCPKPPLPKQPKSLTQDELDATRYRWLREKMFCNETGYLDVAEIPCHWTKPSNTEIDYSIDAAMTPNVELTGPL